MRLEKSTVGIVQNFDRSLANRQGNIHLLIHFLFLIDSDNSFVTTLAEVFNVSQLGMPGTPHCQFFE